MAVELRYATFQDYPRIRDFLDRFWAKDYIYVRDRELFDWTFGRNDLWDRDGYSFALMEDKDEVVGILGAIPFSFNYFGEISRAVWFANYMLHPEYRRGPLAFRLLRAFNRPPFRLQIVFGMNPRVSPIYQRLGWRLLDGIPRHFAVFPNAVNRATALVRLVHPDWDEQRARDLVKNFILDEIPPMPASHSLVLPANWDTAAWPKIASRTAGAARDVNYLTWRYLQHPSFEYRLVAIPGAGHTGIVVWRLETIRRSTAAGTEEIDNIGRIVEFLPASPENARDLLSVVLNELEEAGALGADFYDYHVAHRKWLTELGFRAVDSHADGPVIPSRFQPIESKSSTMLGAVLAEDKLPLYPGDSRGMWYWTKSDADQDRPN